MVITDNSVCDVTEETQSALKRSLKRWKKKGENKKLKEMRWEYRIVLGELIEG